MAEHVRTNQDKQTNVEHNHRNRQQESHPQFDTFNGRDRGIPPLTETPFHAKMDQHAVMLSNIPFSVQRHEFIMHLNNNYGYRYVLRLMDSMKAQAKLTFSDPNDIHEQEADRVAEAVTRSINTPVQRQAPEEEEEELQAQLTENEPLSVSKDLETRINSACGGGQGLSDDVRGKMEGVFGADFIDVRVHTDSEADVLNQQLSAKAFTTGQDIFFRNGEYSPGSKSGQKVIAHELTHVVQQTNGALSKHQFKYLNQMEPDHMEGRLKPLMIAKTNIVVQRDPVIQDDWPDQVKTVCANIDTNMAPAQKLSQLAQNFRNIPFTYEGARDNLAAARDFPRSGVLNSGNCRTLAVAMVAVASDLLQIRGVSAVQEPRSFLRWGDRITIDNRRGNVNDGAGWTFDQHWYVQGPGGFYDPLFAEQLTDQGAWLFLQKTRRGASYRNLFKGIAWYYDIEKYGGTELAGIFRFPSGETGWATWGYLWANYRNVESLNPH